MTAAEPEGLLNGAAVGEVPPTPESAPEAVPVPIDVREKARAAVAALLDAGKVTRDASIARVRYEVGEGIPEWAIRGAWEAALEALPSRPAPVHDAAGWEPQDPESDPPDYLATCDETADAPPVIRVEPNQLDRMANELIAALALREHNLFQRNGELITIVREPKRTEGGAMCEQRRSVAEPCETCGSAAAEACVRDRRSGRDIITRPGTPRLRPVGPSGLTRRASRCAAWEKWKAKQGKAGNEGQGDYVACDPPPRVISIVHEPDGGEGWPGIRPLSGVIETPLIVGGGRIVEAAGYDEETGYMLLPSCRLKPIIGRPTQKHAADALRYMWIEMFCDFPFRGMGEADPADTDRTRQFARALECPDAFVGIAMLLTVFARRAIDGAVPGAAFEAAGQGSGKTLQMHGISIVSTGRPAGVATFPVRDGRPDEAEMEKIVAGYALNAARLLTFDNVRGVLSGSTLEKILTAIETIDIRVLGANDQRTLLWYAVTMFSGNNMVMNDDVADRLLVSRLESARENPRAREASTFRHARLIDAVRARRSNLIRAALTILRAFFCAREDGETIPKTLDMGSFEAWASIIPPAIRWAGGPDVVLAKPAGGHGGDEESSAHALLMRSWPDDWNGQKASYIIERAFTVDEHAMATGKEAPDGLGELRSAIRTLTHTAAGRAPMSSTFGTRIGRLRGKPRDGLRIMVAYDKSAKVDLYRVERIG